MVFKALSCCFGGSAGSASVREAPEDASSVVVPQAPSTQPNFVPTMDLFDPWVHPVEAIIKTAQEEPNALAILTLENGVLERYTYLQLWQRAYSIAQGLKALPGWDDEDHEVVALYCEAESHWAFYSMAIWMLGKRVINLGLNWPSAVRKALSERLKMKFVLYHYVKPGRVAGLEAIDAGNLPQLADIPSPSISVCQPLDDYIAYMSTSGTTGVPKTYPVSHRSIEPSRPNMAFFKGSTGIFQAPSFSIPLWCFVIAFNTRSSVWFAKPTPNPIEKSESVIGLMNEGLEFFFSPPSFVKMFFRVAVSKYRNISWTKTRKLSLGSELVPLSLVRQARELCPNALVQCAYGSSETGVIGALSTLVLKPTDPNPSKLVYSIKKPGVRCLLLDEEGNLLDRSTSSHGILVFAVDKDDPIRDHPNFVNSDPSDKLAPFGFLPDGSPRVCTMDWVEMAGEREFTVIGRFGQKIKVNGVYVDLNALEELANEHMSRIISDCTFVQTSEKKIVMLYVPRKGSEVYMTPAEILQMAQDVFALKNVAKFPIHNCFELHEVPFNDSGKRDLKKLRRIAENVGLYGKSVEYPPLDVDDSALSRIAIKISTLGSRILEAEALDGRNFYIAGVGFDSLSVGRLALAIKDEFDVEISPLILLSNGMTPLDVAQLVIDILDDKPLIPPTVDLAAEAAKLDDASVTAEGLPPFVYPKEVRGIVLTGATGFLGAFLIFELANKFPRAKFYCLVRAHNETMAFLRIFSNASKLVIASRKPGDPWYDVRDRFIGLRGDLSQDKWGLSDDQWKEISEETDMIVHNGAEVHWLFNYERLKGPNVLGTATALRLATTHHLKVLHYISTIGTVPIVKNSKEPLKEAIHSAWNISGGYSQTKWVSEQLVNKARSRGVPVTIIRPAGIVGDTRYGACNTDDYIWRYVKGCIQLGVAPSHATPVTITMDPVDHVAKVVTEIVGSEEALSKFVFHISDSEHSVISETKLFEIANAHGWPVLFETREQFKTLLEANPSIENNALFPLMHMMMDMSMQVDNTNTRSIYPTPCPSITMVAKKSLNYLYFARFLDEPKFPSSSLREEEYPEVPIFSRTGRH
ncbi:male sterility protein-domain-containing protein [Polychytrium aggregatum]|uniref:male sterility protein-domain-containing protein n=1 Tax=Polychytrium aggregatum TaxID=110093 RepID=UPI0022FE6F66|nr:male sterility protein-domain-containing protein [Polychytrium aggregatum]KAI9208148.1 male sterility protein-domain-containing protein [Polychytrium aggregatum]